MFLILYLVLLIIFIIAGAQLLVKYKQLSFLPHLIAISTSFIISIAVFEFMPTIFHAENKTLSSALVFLGLLCFLIFDKFITPKLKFFNSEPSCHKTGCETHDPEQILSKKSSCHSISCLLVCSLFDGLQLGSAQLISEQTQYYLALALFMHIAPSGALAASLSLSGNLGDKFAVKSGLLIAGFLSLGLVISLFISLSTELSLYLIPFICGILIYNIFVHLLPAVFKNKSTIITLIIAFVVSATLLHQH